MLKKPASVVLASFRPSTYPQGVRLGSSLAAALLDGPFWASCARSSPVGQFIRTA